MNHYETLGVEESASQEDIKKAYKTLAQRWHPDKDGGDAEKHKEITEAYTILKDPEKRKLYDSGELEPEPVTPGERAALEAIDRAINRVVSYPNFERISVKAEAIRLLEESIEARADQLASDREIKSRLERVSRRMKSALYRGAISRKLRPLNDRIKENVYFMEGLQGAIGVISSMDEEDVESAATNNAWRLPSNV